MATSNVYERQVVSGIVPDSAGLLDDPLKPRDIGGRRRVLYATATFTAADGIGASVNVAKLPLGARVLNAELNVTGAFPASTTATLGDSDDADRYLGATALSSAGIVGTFLATGYGYVIATEAQRTIILTTAVGDPADGDVVEVMMEYVID